ncbi:3-ketoacyl-acp reductase [Nannochloropsis oceanica]
MPPRPIYTATKGDLLLELSQKAALRPWLAKLGLPTPVQLDRGIQTCFSSPPLAGRPITLVGPQNAAAGTIDALSIIFTQKLGAKLSGPSSSNVLVDTTWVRSPADVSTLAMQVLQPLAARKLKHGRIVLLSSHMPGDVMSTSLSSGLASLVRSFAKEMGPTGTNVNIVNMRGFFHSTSSLSTSFLSSPFSLSPSPDSLALVAWPLAFLLLPDAAFITGQEFIINVGTSSTATAATDTTAAMSRWLENLPPSSSTSSSSSSSSFSSSSKEGLLNGKSCLVTGSSRGIGEAITLRLAREGARVIGVDLPGTSTQLQALMDRVGGVGLPLDLTVEGVEERLKELVRKEGNGGKIDCLVHNAGLTKDKTLRRMTPEQFHQVVKVNLEAVLNINKAFGLAYQDEQEGGANGQDEEFLNPGGRIVLLSSINGIAGAFGQTNYSFTKAALSSYAQSLAPILASRGPSGSTINAIAPGFIETDMTQSIPALGKFLGRRANAFSQGGLADDVAAVVAFLCCDGSGGMSGQTLRVCGLNAVGK